MSSPMIASCRPTCPMVLEEWEPVYRPQGVPFQGEGTCVQPTGALPIPACSELRKPSLRLPPPPTGATLSKHWRWNKHAHRGLWGHWRSAPRPSPGRRRSVCLTETSGWPLRRSGQLLGTDSSPCTSSFRNQPWPKFPLKESLSDEEKGKEEEMEEDDSSFKLCVPGIVPLQSPLPKTFRSTDTVGFVESELKNLLIVQRESGLWKMGSHEGRELLTQPEITLEEHLLLEEMDEMGNRSPE
uniref:uncharacterized protein LOC129513045 isoform X2 n=1 Tax=Nyctereutes procyonoides TaxID=34880 RepID=UPI00244419A7|nr:uncharacterized protein LOC129513045 isoform X2 [Nyctereutes procyonoides]